MMKAENLAIIAIFSAGRIHRESASTKPAWNRWQLSPEYAGANWQ